MTDLVAEQPIDAIPETPPVVEDAPEAAQIPEPSTQDSVTISLTGSQAGMVAAIAQPTFVIPQPIKETFFEKCGKDVDEAIAWLEKELAKL